MVYRNAIACEKHELSRNVLGVKDPATIKAFGKNQFQALDQDTKMKHMKGGMTLKYGQNDYLKELLRETMGTTLAEASPFDAYWGILKRITDEEAFNGNWEGMNITGTL